MLEEEIRNCPSVRSTVNYLGEMDAVPVFYAQHRERDNLVLESSVVDIFDARKLTPPPSLEVNGFMLASHATAVADFTDRDAALAVYRPEIEALLHELTGAARVIVGNAVLRWSERSGPRNSFVNSDPARFVHVDYSRQSFDEFARMHLGIADDAAEWLARRYVAYNVWRVLTPPPQDVALAVCDARTWSPADVTSGEAVIDAPDAPEVRFGSSLYHASAAHRWFWYPDMRPDEALIFKAFDSDTGRVGGCPHSAFDNPKCEPGVTPRASVEIRAYAFY
jgi:hypothetical protein